FALHFLELARTVQAAGFEVHVIAGVGEREDFSAVFAEAGVHFHPIHLSRTGLTPLRDLATIARLLSLYREIRPDLVHHIAIKPVLYGQIAALLAGVPVRINALTGLGYVYASPRLKARVLRPLVSLGLRLLLPRGRARLIVLNEDDAADLAAITGLCPERIVVIPGTGIDLVEFQPSDEPAEVPPVVAMVGRMLTDKGVHELVSAVERLRAAGQAVILRLVGAPDPKNPASIDADQLAAWADAGTIDYRGFVRDIPAVWREAHVAVLPSYREGLGMSLIEAAACGRPLIATDVAGCRQAVVDGVTGMLVPARDSVALATAIEALLADPERRRAMGVAARADAEKRFDKAIVLERTLALYRDSLALT
ncbi:MAG: glycosyltransferase family 4 protein, partial [Pseudomonadota bacterium]|nr:glycosyltransferase family 4 protein [Pseudomonadota bacterium]